MGLFGWGKKKTAHMLIDEAFDILYSEGADFPVQKARCEKALKKINEALNLEPENIGGIYSKGIIEIYLGNIKDAEKDIVLSLKRDFSIAIDFIKIGMTWAGIGREQQNKEALKMAIFCYDLILKVNPTDFEASLNRANVLAGDIKTRKNALEIYDKLLKSHPANLDVLYNKASTLKEESPDLALKLINKIKKIDPTYPDLDTLGDLCMLYKAERFKKK